MLEVFSPDRFRSTGVQFVSTLDVPEFDLSEVDKLSRTLVDIDNKNVKSIEDNFNNLLNTQDALTGLDGGTAYGFNLINEVKKDYNLNDDIFNFTMDQLKDPFHQREVQNRLQKAMTDPRMREALIEGQAVQQARNDIRQLSRTNRDMALIAKEELNKIVSDPDSQKTILEFSIGDFEEVDAGAIFRQELEQIREDNPNLSFIPRGDSPLGFKIFDKVSEQPIDERQFVDQMLSSYLDDPRFRNTLRSKTNKDLPPGERTIDDPQAIERFIKDNAKQVFSSFGGRRIIDSTIQQDRIAVDNQQTANDLLIEGAKAENRQDLEELQNENRVELEKIKSDGRIELEKVRGANRVALQKVKGASDSKSTYDKKTNTILNQLNSEGKTIRNQEDAVNLDSRLKKGDQVEVDKEGNQVIVTDPTGSRRPLIIPLNEFGDYDVASGLLAENPFIQSNYKVGGQKWNYASEFLMNPDVQDGFYTDYYVPEILDRGVENIKVDGVDTSDYNNNQLRYLVHHQGEAGARHFIETGEILPEIVEAAGADRDVLDELTNALSQFSEEGDFEEIKDRVESAGDYSAVTTLPNSSALGKHQILFDTFFEPIKDYIDSNGGLTILESRVEPLNLEVFNRNTPEGKVQTTRKGRNIVTNDPNIVAQFPNKDKRNAKAFNKEIKVEEDKLEKGGLFGTDQAGPFIELTEQEFRDASKVAEPTGADIKRGNAFSLLGQLDSGDSDEITLENIDDGFGFRSIGDGEFEVFRNGDIVTTNREQLERIIEEVYPESTSNPELTRIQNKWGN